MLILEDEIKRALNNENLLDKVFCLWFITKKKLKLNDDVLLSVIQWDAIWGVST